MLHTQLIRNHTSQEFETVALKVFRYQHEHVSTYRKFCDLLRVDVSEVKKLQDIPFMPIEFFKEHRIIASTQETEKIFTSSGTTGTTTSKHYIANLEYYKASFMTAFHQFYGAPKEYAILALLPSYLERGGSSLVYMVDSLIRESTHPQSGFYLDNLNALANQLRLLETKGQKTLLIGVSYALLDLIETSSFKLKNTIIMETGGMKGRRKEMIKQELHKVLQQGFGVAKIHSEYGMTELLSQAYSLGSGLFECPPWMKISTRDPEDALSLVHGKTGGINVIDLANLYSCSFIATQDLGKVHPDESFEILGRFDTSDIRGCNLMVI